MHWEVGPIRNTALVICAMVLSFMVWPDKHINTWREMALRKLRDCLEKNKIFFEIFSMLLLGTMSITVSIASLKISEQQKELSLKALEPHFRIKEFILSDGENNDGKQLRIFNDGHRVKNFDSDVFVYARFIRYGKVANSYKDVVVNISGYYFISDNKQASNGLLVTHTGILSNKLHGQLWDQVIDLNSESKKIF